MPDTASVDHIYVNDVEDTKTSLGELIVRGSFLGFLASANFATYYLLKVCKISVLKENRVDEYSSECVTGAKSCLKGYVDR